MENQKIARPNTISEAWWKEVCKKLKNSVVFLDDFVAESLHWSGTIQRLFNAGCNDVKQFTTFERCKKGDEKSVFLLGGPVCGVAADTLRDIIRSSSFKYVTVVSGANHAVHAYAAFGGREVDERAVMNKLEEQILEWMGNLNYTVEIFHFPLILVPPSKDLFLLPIFSNIIPILEDELPVIMNHCQEFGRLDRKHINSIDELEFHHLPFSLRLSIFHFIVCIHSFLQGMLAREEIYSIGHLASIVAEELETFNPARQRRKMAANKVSLVFVDRTLDLVSPANYDSSNLMSKILNILPRIPGQVVDSAINLSPITAVHPSCDWTIMPGCIAHTNEPKGMNVFEEALHCTRNETLKKINQKGKEALDLSDHHTSTGSSVIEQIEENVKLICEDDTRFKKNFDLIQQSLAVIETVKHSQNPHLDHLHSIQKLLLQSLNDAQAEKSPIDIVLNLLKSRGENDTSVEEVLVMLLYLASLECSSALSNASEYGVTNALSQAFIQNKDKCTHTLHSIFGSEIDEVSALKTAQRIWRRLVSISMARNNLKDYRDLYSRDTEVEPFTYSGLIPRLVKDCLEPPSTPVSDLEYKSAGLKDFIKTGFSLFVNVSKPRPKDAALIIIYVLGGVTASEIHEIKSILKKCKPSCEVLIGSSHLTYPQDIVEKILKDKIS